MKLNDDCEHCENKGYIIFNDNTFMKCFAGCVASLLYWTAIGNPKNPFNFRNCRSNPFE